MARMMTPHERRRLSALRREIEAGVAKAARPQEKQQVSSLKDMLRNVSRTATRALDEAGVPDRFQTEQPGDWDINDEERDWP